MSLDPTAQQNANDTTPPIGAIGDIPALPKATTLKVKHKETRWEQLAKLTTDEIVGGIVRRHEQDPWLDADDTLYLKSKRNLEFKQIAALAEKKGEQSYTVAHLSQRAAAAETFPDGRRFRFLSFTAHQKIGQDVKRINKQRAEKGEATLDPFELLNALFDSRPEAKGFSASQIKIAIRDRVRAMSPTPQPATEEGLVNVCLHADCIEIGRLFAPGSAALVNLDPVYADYTRTEGGELDKSTTKGYADADNASREEAIESTVAALKAYAHVPDPGGYMTLWQSDRPLRPEIFRAIEDIGYDAWILPWLKRGASQIGRMHERTGGAIEVCYILRRKEDRPRRDVQVDRLSGILDYKPVDMGDVTQPHHMFEKPVEMMRQIVEALTPEDSHVVDAFACTGSLSKACIETGRTFTYVEKNKANFDHFAGIVQRLRDDVKARSEDHPPEERN